MKFFVTFFSTRFFNFKTVFTNWIIEKWNNFYFRIFTFIFLTIIVLGFTLPIIFRKPLALRVINSIDIDIIEQVNFSRVDFSLFRSFPYLNIRISDFSTLGSKDLGNSKLLTIKYMDIAVDIWSVIDKSRPIFIRSVRLFEPKLTLLINKSGKKNYEVPLTNELISPVDSSYKSKINFNLALQSIEIKNGFLLFEDENSNIYVKADRIWHQGSGDLRTNFYDLKTKTKANEVSISFGSTDIMEKAKISLDIDFYVDKIKKEYFVKENNIKVNELSLQVKGLIKHLNSNYYYDLNIYAPDNHFSELIKLLPSLKNSGFRASQEIKGDFNLSLGIKGPFQVVSGIYPTFNGFLKINNGSIQEYFKEEGISDIQTSISICNDSQDLSDLEIQIPKMEACVEGKDFKLAMYLKNPIYDPFVHGFVKGEINLKSLQKYLPLFSNNELNGVVNTDIFIKGKMSDVDNNNYKNVLMDGSIKMKNFSWQKSNNHIYIKTLNAILYPEILKIPLVKGNYNGNELLISGNIFNALAYFSPLKTLKGSFSVNAKETILDKWFIPEPKTKKIEFIELVKETTPSQNIDYSSVPFKIGYDFDIAFNAGKVKYKNNIMENVSFSGNYKLNHLYIRKLRFNYNQIELASSGRLLNTDNYLFRNGILKGNLSISASKVPFILPSADLVSQSNIKSMNVETKSKLINKIIPIISKRKNPKVTSYIPERVIVRSKIKIDSILSSDQTFSDISFFLNVDKNIMKMSKGIAYNKNMPISWQGEINRQNNFAVRFDFKDYQTDLFSIPKQSPLQYLNLIAESKQNRPTGLKISGNIGNAPEYKFSNLNYLFFTNMGPLLEKSQLQPFNGLKNSKLTVDKEGLKWWISYENKRFIFWPLFLQFNDIAFYFTGYQEGEKECFFKIRSLIPISYLKLEEWMRNNNIFKYPAFVEVDLDIEDCMSANFSMQLKVNSDINDILKQRIEKVLRFELNKEFRRIYGQEKIKNNMKIMKKEPDNYLSSIYQKPLLWNNYYKLNDSLESAFISLKPKIR